jgi:uncharacterized protein with NRDE domain
MCTLAVALRSDPRWPLVVAANRDERLGRPAEGWAPRRTADGTRYVAPRDALAGGTWIGVSEHGLLAAVTNYHAPLEWYPDPARRSRGELVPLALAHRRAADARAALAREDAARWNPFHLVVADGADAEGGFLWWYDGERAGIEALGAGLHVVTESARDGAGPRGELVRARWPVDLAPARLRELLAVHRGAAPDRAATCIHAEPAYGTRSATIVRLARELGNSELYVAEGHPCVTPFEDRSALLAALSRPA